jgi:positive regulator of sigma E activity
VSVGETVTLSCDEHHFSQQVFKVYVPSLVGLIVPIFVGQSQGWNEMIQAGAAVFGLSLGWVVSRHWARNFEIRVNR